MHIAFIIFPLLLLSSVLELSGYLVKLQTQAWEASAMLCYNLQKEPRAPWAHAPSSSGVLYVTTSQPLPLADTACSLLCNWSTHRTVRPCQCYVRNACTVFPFGIGTLENKTDGKQGRGSRPCICSFALRGIQSEDVQWKNCRNKQLKILKLCTVIMSYMIRSWTVSDIPTETWIVPLPSWSRLCMLLYPRTSYLGIVLICCV